MTLPLYDKNSKCPKCGESGAGTHYLSTYECVERRCQNCHHSWVEAPLDSVPAAEKPVEKPAEWTLERLAKVLYQTGKVEAEDCGQCEIYGQCDLSCEEFAATLDNLGIKVGE